MQTSVKMTWVSVNVIVKAVHVLEVNKYWNLVLNTYSKSFYWLFNQSNIALMITNVHSTIIESSNIAYHWKTGQKPSLCSPPVPNEVWRTQMSVFLYYKQGFDTNLMLFYWLFNHNNIELMFKCLKYHSWGSTSGTQLENLAKFKKNPPTYAKQKFDAPNR